MLRKINFLLNNNDFFSSNKLFIFLFVTISLNVIIRCNIISYILIFAQIFYLVFLFLKKEYLFYYTTLLSFTFLTFELDYYISPLKIVDFKTINIAGISLPNLFFIPIFILSLFHIKIILKKIFNYKFGKIFIFLFFCQLLSLILGVLNYIFNVNNILSIENIHTVILNIIYENYFLILFPLIPGLYLINAENSHKIITVIKKSLLVTIFIAITTVLFGIHGEYGAQQTIIAPNIIVFTPILLIFSFYEEKIK